MRGNINIKSKTKQRQPINKLQWHGSFIKMLDFVRICNQHWNLFPARFESLLLLKVNMLFRRADGYLGYGCCDIWDAIFVKTHTDVQTTCNSKQQFSRSCNPQLVHYLLSFGDKEALLRVHRPHPVSLPATNTPSPFKGDIPYTEILGF